MNNTVKLNILKLWCLVLCSTINVVISSLLSLSTSFLLRQLHVLALLTARDFLCLAELVINCLHDLIQDCIRVDIR